jgi:hypothetical protein
VRPTGLCQRKIPLVPSGIEPATFLFVVQCLNQLRNRVPPLVISNMLKHLHITIYDKISYKTLFQKKARFNIYFQVPSAVPLGSVLITHLSLQCVTYQQTAIRVIRHPREGFLLDNLKFLTHCVVDRRQRGNHKFWEI